MSTTLEEKIRQFVKVYFKSKQGIITENGNVLTVTYPDTGETFEYTYEQAIARQTKAQLITVGSPAFQQILKECLEKGAPCQIQINPKENVEALIRSYFKDTLYECQNCFKLSTDKETIHICHRTQPCYHKINYGKIESVNISRSETSKYFLFYNSVVFQNKLRPKSEEQLSILIDEKSNIFSCEEFNEDNFRNSAIEFQDTKSKLKPEVFDMLKTKVEEELITVLQEKVLLYDLSLGKEKKVKLRAFDKRLRRERREQVISKKHDFDYVKWQSNYEKLVKREEDSYVTSLSIRFINLLVINTTKLKFEIHLDNRATITGSFVLGINKPLETSCSICHTTITEGYATQDGLYVCGDCIRQSVDSGKCYSKKANLMFDKKLGEYIERDGGFICSVCGKKHSKLLEFKCSHDNSSICIYHYGTCDVCGKVFSKLNLTYTDEFERQMCPKHAKPRIEV